MKHVLVVGAAGQLGAALCREGQRRGIRCTGAARQSGAERRVDLEEPASYRDLVTRDVDAVFIAAGYTFVDKAESEPARVRQINTTAAGDLAEQAKRYDIPVVYYSTDYVFDGTRATPYDEDAATNPMSVYGATKLEGEHAVLGASDKNVVLRTSVVYGFDENEKNFVYQTLRAAREGRQLTIASDQRANPTFNDELAWASFELVAQGASGVVNAVGPEGLLRPQFGAIVCDVFGLEAEKVYVEKPTSAFNQPARRPLNGSLADTKLRRLLGRPLASPRAGLEAFKSILSR